jgi:hypothetical protein
MEEGAVTKVLNDFLTVSEGEISLKKGDIVQVSSNLLSTRFLAKAVKIKICETIMLPVDL